MPGPRMRPYGGEDDYWRIRAFLRRTFLKNGRRDVSWQPARLDYWRWHVIENCGTCPPLEEVTWLWEDARGEIAAVLCPENIGEAHLQIDPDFLSEGLQEEMIRFAEEHLSKDDGHGGRTLNTMAAVKDPLLQDLLGRLGHSRDGRMGWDRYRVLDDNIPMVQPAEGYTVRSLGGEEELPARSWASWRAFHADEPDGEYQGWEWYRNIQRIPLYRRDLDIVGTTPDGLIVAFCTVWYDDVTRTGYFEPVGRMPEHDVRGLMRGVLSLGLRRLRSLGADLAMVGGTSFGANVLYASLFGLEAERYDRWSRTW
jgi:mycothiol synthase